MKLFWVFNGIVIYIRECVKVIFSDMRLAFKDSFQYPRVTVVVPVLNEEKFLENCLQSIRSQTYQNWECIVVDDGSTDKSPEIAKNFEKIDSRIRCVFHEVNFGLAAARNTGVKHAKGQLITFLDADDFLFSSSLWQRVFPLVKVDQKKHAGCFCGIVAGHQWKGFGSFYSLRFRFQKREVIDFISAKGECPFNAHAPLIWTSIIRDFGGFKESMVHGAEDWELWFRILRHGYKFIPSYGYGGVYRQKPNSMIRKSPGIHVHEAMRLIEKSYEKYVPDEVSPGGPYLFKESLGFYERAVIEAKRLIGFALMAHLGGNQEARDEILSLLDASIIYLIDAHINFDQIMDDYITRFYCLSPLIYKKKKQEFHFLKKEFKNKVFSHFKLISPILSLDSIKAN